MLLVTMLLGTALAVMAVGCGDDEGDTPSTTVEAGTLSKGQYIKKAEKICARERNRMGKDLLALEAKDEQASLVAAQDSILIPGMEAEVELLAELGAPKGDEAQIEAMLGAMVEAIEETSARQAKTFDELTEPFGRFDKLVTAYGMEGCIFA
jgi:hypothetical protein